MGRISFIFTCIDERENKGFRTNPVPTDERLESCLRQLGRVSERSRNLSWKEARKNYLEGLVKAQEKFSISAALEKELSSGEAFVGGDEHLNVQIQSKSNRVFKVTGQDQFGVKWFFDGEDREHTGKHFHATENLDPFFYLNRWKLLNRISLYQTKFEGIIGPERENFLPRLCVSQPYLAGPSPSVAQISHALKTFGYHEVSQGAYFSSETEVLLTDTFPRNVRVHGVLPALFDSVASQPTGKVRDWLLEKIADQ